MSSAANTAEDRDFDLRDRAAKAIFGVHLNATAKVVLSYLLDRVCWSRWVVPRAWRSDNYALEDRGVSLAELARIAGVSRSTIKRCIWSLDDAGLIRIHPRGYETHAFELRPLALIERAARDLATRARDLAAEGLARVSSALTRIASRLGGESRLADRLPDATELAEGAPAPLPAPATPPGAPKWALDLARRHGLAPDVVLSVTGAVSAVLYGERAHLDAQGGLARAAVRLWMDRGQPATAQLAEDLAVMVRAARRDPSAVWDALRGWTERDRGPKGSARLPWLGDLAGLLHRAPFEGRLQAARDFAARADAEAAVRRDYLASVPDTPVDEGDQPLDEMEEPPQLRPDAGALLLELSLALPEIERAVAEAHVAPPDLPPLAVLPRGPERSALVARRSARSELLRDGPPWLEQVRALAGGPGRADELAPLVEALARLRSATDALR